MITKHLPDLKCLHNFVVVSKSTNMVDMNFPLIRKIKEIEDIYYVRFNLVCNYLNNRNDYINFSSVSKASYRIYKNNPERMKKLLSHCYMMENILCKSISSRYKILSRLNLNCIKIKYYHIQNFIFDLDDIVFEQNIEFIKYGFTWSIVLKNIYDDFGTYLHSLLYIN